MKISLVDMRDMLDMKMFEVFPALSDYSLCYCEYDSFNSRRHVGKRWYDFIKKTYPESLDSRFGFRMKSWDTFQYWVIPKYKVFGEINRAERERQMLIQFLTDWISKCGNLEIDL